MKILKYILLLLLILTLQGCTYRIVTDYENCVSKELIFEFKDNIKLYIIDDSKATYKYSSMNFPKGEHYLFLCSDEENKCIKEYSGQYYQGWELIKVESKPFYLTGRYKTNEPNFILGAFAPDTSALQIEIGGIKAWLSEYDLDINNMKKSSANSIKELNKNRKLSTDWNDWMTKFECPNIDVKKSSWELIWFN